MGQVNVGGVIAAGLVFNSSLTPFSVLEKITTLTEKPFLFETTACFAKGTLVHTREGLVPIENLKVGDWVLSKPEDGTGEVAYKRVTQTFAHGPTEVVNLLYRFGGDDDSIFAPNTQHRRLTTTLNHPFWVVGQGWTEANGLSGWPGRESRLTLIDGQQAITSARESIFQTSTSNVGWTSSVGNLTDVLGGEWDFENECVHRANVPAEDGIQDLAYPPSLKIPVYNIEVEEFHTYFVGKEGVWVHNKNLTTRKMGQARIKAKTRCSARQICASRYQFQSNSPPHVHPLPRPRHRPSLETGGSKGSAKSAVALASCALADMNRVAI